MAKRGAHTDADGDRQDVRDSVTLVGAAIGVAAGLYLVRYDTLYFHLLITVLGIGIAAMSALSVFVRQRWVGVVVIALALAATFMLFAADFYTMEAVVSAILAAIAGIVIIAAPHIYR